MGSLRSNCYLLLLHSLVLRFAVAFVPHGRFAECQHINGRSGQTLPSGSRKLFNRARSLPKIQTVGLPPFNQWGSRSTGGTSVLSVFGNMELEGLFYADTSLAFDAWEWTANIGAPAALVAGAVLVTLSETREDLAPRQNDKNWVRTLKRTMRFLLLSSFVLEVVSIFVGTMTGSVLLGHGTSQAAKKVGYEAPLQLLHHHHEFEYLTTQICFLQGLFNWLGAVAVELLLPKSSETKSARRMNKCLVGWLISIILWMLAFYNNHLSFYSDYAEMMWKWFGQFLKRYVLCKPFRPMSLLYGPSFTISMLLTWRAFTSPPEEDEN